MSSAVSMLVTITGAFNGSYSSFIKLAARSLSTPMTILSGCIQS